MRGGQNQQVRIILFSNEHLNRNIKYKIKRGNFSSDGPGGGERAQRPDYSSTPYSSWGKLTICPDFPGMILVCQHNY